MNQTDVLSTSYINEFPHPAFVVHYHPDTSQFHLRYVQEALDKQVSAIELDLHYRSSDHQVVCNHDSASSDSPTLKEVFNLVLKEKGDDQTIYNKGFQFFFVLEPKQDSDVLFDSLRKILEDYSDNWSTAVSSDADPRGITVVVTGAYKTKFFERLPTEEKATLCLIEGRNYPEVVNQSASGNAFKWRNFNDEGAKGQINKAHDDGFNTRIWGAEDLKRSFACGSDSVNCDMGRINECKAMLRNQEPRGYNPTLAVNGSQVALAWRGKSSNNIFTSTGTVNSDGLNLTRQVLLTWLLEQTPEGFAPAVIFDQDDKLLTVYQGTSESRLWYVSGEFTSYDRYLTFAGGEHRLTTEDEKRRGTNPSVALAPDGRLVILYTGTTESRLWYFTGRLDGGVLKGAEHKLTREDGRWRGTNPSIAISATGKVIAIYEGTRDNVIWYVTGKLNAQGEIEGTEHRFTWDKGFTPWATFDPDGRVLIVYRNLDDAHLSFVYGTFTGDGPVEGKKFSLTTSEDKRRGYTPAAAFYGSGKVIIMYRALVRRKSGTSTETSTRRRASPASRNCST